MEYEKIKQLMDDMGNSKLSSIDIEFPDGIKIKMEKKENTIIKEVTNVKNNDAKTTNYSGENNNDANAISYSENNNNQNLENDLNKEEGNIVKSPMVGTFYIKSSPSSNPYVEVGTEVKEGDVLCIIEAMKLMNEIESEYTGKIAEIYVKDGEPVEYGKPLFRIV